MKVIDEKSGVKAHSSNKTAIEHGIAQKTELSKKNGKELTSRATHEVRHADDRKTPHTEQHRTDIPRNAQHNKQKSGNKRFENASRQEEATNNEYSSKHISEQNIGDTTSSPKQSSARAAHYPKGYAYKGNKHKGKYNTAHRKNNAPTQTSDGKADNKAPTQHKAQTEKALQKKVQNDSKAPSSDSSSAPKPPKYKQFQSSRKVDKRKHHKVLKNGTVSNDTLQKKKQRVIYRKKEQAIHGAKPKEIGHKLISTSGGAPLPAPKSKPIQPPKPETRRKADISKRLKNKKMRLKRLNKSMSVKLTPKQAAAIKQKISKAKQTAADAKSGVKSATKAAAFGKSVGGAGKVAKLATKPVGAVGNKLLSQRANTQKTEDSGTEAIKLGLQTADYARTGARTIKSAVNKSGKAVRKVSKKIERHISNASKRTLNKSISKTTTKAVKNTVKTAAKGAKNAVKAAKTTVQAAQKAAQAAAKAAQAAAKAVASAVAKVAAFIAETMPYSLIVIGVIVLVILLCLCVTQLMSGTGGSVAGGGAWLVNDENGQTPEEIYNGYKEYIESAKTVMESQAKQALENTVTGFCSSDTSDPHKIIQYIDKSHNLTLYPASGADSTINPLIEQFGTDDYADYMSLLFVLMTREKQQADGVSDGEIYDFDFKLEDFQEFMKTVNENSCRWGDTFVYKTAVETSGNACPNENCKRKYIAGCTCCSYTDDEGHIHHYCGGHSYCPHNHDKMTVQLYTIKDYYGMDYPDIYHFTDNEKARYEASKAVIQAMLDYWE